MSKIHYFQRYSQKENVVTNNTLLLFSRLYNYSPIRFNAFINSLFDGDPVVNVGLDILQQSKRRGANIPDGSVSQESFCLLIETKLSPHFSLEQLRGHLKSFRDEKTKILLLIAPALSNTKLEGMKKGIYLKQTTFEAIINAGNTVLAEHDFEMKDIVEDYANFCAETKLLPTAKYTLRIVPCGVTLEDNLAFNMYYAPANRSYREFNFLGVYKDRRVQGIGKLRAIAELETKSRKVKAIKGTVSFADEKSINKMIALAQEQHGYFKRNEAAHFFITDKFHKANFRKETIGGIYNQRYIDLRDYFPEGEPFDNAERITQVLSDKTWR